MEKQDFSETLRRWDIAVTKKSVLQNVCWVYLKRKSALLIVKYRPKIEKMRLLRHLWQSRLVLPF